MDNKPTFDTICLSGGGVKGLSFLGAIDYLELHSYIDISLITNWFGTSIGAIIAFIYTLGYNTCDIGDFILDFNFDKLQPDVDINNLLGAHGIDDGSKLLLLIKRFLKQKYNIDDITFEEHYKLTNKKLNIVGTNFSKGLETLFNYETSPTMSILTAVRISSSIPIIFTPVLYNSDYYIDGAFVNNFPIKYCNPNSTLGIYIKNSCCNELTSIVSLINGFISIITDTISEKDNLNKYDYIIEINNYMQEVVNFNLDKEKKLKIINLGQVYARKYLNNICNRVKFSFSKDTQTEMCNKNDKETQTDDIITKQEEITKEEL
jgi:predicted patatin/cPLA2 family phospholipase